MRSNLKTQRLKARIGALRSQHTRIEATIGEEMKRPAPDSMRVALLKRLKLKTKDEIQMTLGLLRTLARPDAGGLAKARRAAT